ncbi:hypothetical protein ACFSL6_04450 [Paenibacillus thailandensis]
MAYDGRIAFSQRRGNGDAVGGAVGRSVGRSVSVSRSVGRSGSFGSRR